MDGLPPVNAPIVRNYEMAHKVSDNQTQKIFERQEMMCALLTELVDKVEGIRRHFGIAPYIDEFSDAEER